jgi:catechol 2,3-dioxygenase-like lactoylglutathione lyase family enzyme
MPERRRVPSLPTLKKQAKQLLDWHRARNHSVGPRVRALTRYRTLTDAEVLALKFPLAEAQEVLAVELGFARWAELKAAAAPAPSPAAAAASGPPRLTGAAPLLYVSDVTRSAHFFCDTLGFTIGFLHGDPPFYGEVARDAVRIHLRHVHEPAIDPAVRESEALLSAFVTVENVRELYRVYLANDAPMAQTLRKEPWGALVFIVVDPDGNWISFNGSAGPGATPGEP